MADNNLTEEIILQEILIRLPVKSLVRCRCVCKLWNTILSCNPNFVYHYNRFHNPNRELDDDDDYVICLNDYIDTKDNKPRYGLSILSRNNSSETHIDYPAHHILIGSINGLICTTAYHDQLNSRDFLLWNPILPFFMESIVPKHNNYADEYWFLYGFGWDSVTDDYKLIIADTTREVLAAHVYSFKTHCWSNSKEIFISLYGGYKSTPCIIVNGFPYWRSTYDTYDSHGDNDILKFDVRDNRFMYLKVPSLYALSSYDLINLDDCLALVEYIFKRGATNVYRFDEERSIWAKMYTIDESVNISTKLLCFKYGGELLFDENRQLYDPKSHTSKQRHLGFCKCRLRVHNEIKRRGSCECLVKLLNEINCRDCGGSLVNGFSYTPSLLAFQECYPTTN